MARRSRRRRFGNRVRKWYRRRDKRIPLIPTIATISSIAIAPCPSGRNLAGDLMAGDFEGLMYDAREHLAGIDNTGKLRVEWLIGTYSPIIISALASKFLGKFVNPSLAKIPMLGKYIKL